MASKSCEDDDPHVSVNGFCETFSVVDVVVAAAVVVVVIVVVFVVIVVVATAAVVVFVVVVVVVVVNVVDVVVVLLLLLFWLFSSSLSMSLSLHENHARFIRSCPRTHFVSGILFPCDLWISYSYVIVFNHILSNHSTTASAVTCLQSADLFQI